MSPAQRKDTRSRLLAAATDLFSSVGYEGTTVDQITRAAKANRALVSYHFGGKKGLFVAVIEQYLDAAETFLSSDSLVADQANEVGNGRDMLRQWIHVYLDFLAEHPQFARIMAREQMSGAPNIDPALAGRFMGFLKRTDAVLKIGIADGSLVKADSHAVHLVMAGAYIYFLLTSGARKRYGKQKLKSIIHLDQDVYRNTLVDLIIRGLTPTPTDPKRKKQR